jgi:Flp pilus assembly protein TadG
MIFQFIINMGNRPMRDFRRCSMGAVAVLTALILPVLLGFTSLGVEVGHWYLAQRQMQGGADAAAISAAAEYIHQYNSGNPASTSYQTVGQTYASLNGFTIPTSNICLYTASGTNPGCTAGSVDTRLITCTAPPCIVAEVTQNTLNWVTTRASAEPTGQIGRVQAIPTPTIMARAVVAIGTALSTTSAGDCVLALANDPQAILVHGNGDLKATCGIAADGGIDQNASDLTNCPVTNPSYPKCGGITFNGGPSRVDIESLTVAASTATAQCPGAHCFDATGAALPAAKVHTSTATLDPYAATLNFPVAPLGVQTGGVQIKSLGTGYGPNGVCTFKVDGGTGTPAQFTATITGGKLDTTKPVTVTDPGAYTVFPSNPVTATATTCGGSQKATFNLTQGCFTWNGNPIPGRKYCSINANNVTLNFPAGNYYIAGGDSGCVGFCAQGGGSKITSDPAGVVFFLMKGDGANSRGPTFYATISITGMGKNGSLALCAPGTVKAGTVCGDPSNDTCNGSCLLFVQDPTATGVNGESSAQGTASTTVNEFAGNANTTLGGLAYLPKQTFDTQGNTTILGCFGVIAKYVDVGGTPAFSDGCLPGNGIGSTTTTSLTSPKLVQ